MEAEGIFIKHKVLFRSFPVSCWFWDYDYASGLSKDFHCDQSLLPVDDIWFSKDGALWLLQSACVTSELLLSQHAQQKGAQPVSRMELVPCCIDSDGQPHKFEERAEGWY